MTNYQITIVKVVPNENYKEEMRGRAAANAGRYRDDSFSPEPKKEFVKDVLMCELTEEQFAAVKAAVLKVFE
jgi:hypothetical protein